LSYSPVPDRVFRLAGIPDPFAAENPYLLALLDLPPKSRRCLVRQVILLCAAIPALEPLDALELLAKVAPYLNHPLQNAN